jgi:hypothetical protein
LAGAFHGKAVPMRTVSVLYWFVIVGGVFAAFLVAVLNA